MSKKSDISDDDRALFREAVKGTKPLNQDKIAIQTRSRRIPKKSQQTDIEQSQPQWSDHVQQLLDGDAYVQFAHTGIARKTLRDMKQGKFLFEASLDLHGATVAKARELLHQFLQDCYKHRYRQLLIIHGKGFKSGRGAKLKTHVVNWLQQSDIVLAACSALSQHGGTGALYVLLRADKKKTIEPRT